MTSPAPCPCIFREKTERRAMRVNSAVKEVQSFTQKYAVMPQSITEFQEIINSGRKIELYNTPQITKLPSLLFNYVGRVDGMPKPQEQIFTDILKNRGISVVLMPGAYTPTCTGTHLPGLLTVENLKKLKQAGIDFLLIATPDTQDVVCKWVREAANSQGVEFLVPDILPELNPEERLPVHNEMPIILPYADHNLALANMLGFVMPNHRLGITCNRGYAVFSAENNLVLVEKAEDPSHEKCFAVLAPAMLNKIQNAPTKSAVLA